MTLYPESYTVADERALGKAKMAGGVTGTRPLVVTVMEGVTATGVLGPVSVAVNGYVPSAWV